ncbi:MAG: ion transporter [Silanimonas sp.]
MAKPKPGGTKRAASGGTASGTATTVGVSRSGAWASRVRRGVAAPGFAAFTQALIALNAFALGVEAVPAFGEPLGPWLSDFFALSTAWFVVEIALRMVAHGRPLAGFFRDGWNLFDTVVVLVSLLPLAGGVAIVARLLRLLRLLRLVSGSSLLRGFVSGGLPYGQHLLAGGLLLALSLYAFSLAGFHLAGGVLADATPWADLPNALRSTAAWSVVLAPPPLPDAGASGSAWLIALGIAHVTWLGLLLRGLFQRKRAA